MLFKTLITRQLFFNRGRQLSFLILIFCSIHFFSLSTVAQDASLLPPSIYDSAMQHLGSAIRIKTVSINDSMLGDSSQFEQFRTFLESVFPAVHTKLKRNIINQFSYIYEWPGKNTGLKPYVLMAHQDVVPVEDISVASWRHPPFSGAITGDTVWGRGAVDNKGALIAIMESAEGLIKQNFQPERTIYFCFGHDEEISGKWGAKEMAAWFAKNNIQPELVLDEGLEVIERKFKDFEKPVALIGVGEKGYASFELVVEKPGGHSSVPEKETAISILSNALVKLNKHQPPARMIEPVKIFLKRMRPHLSLAFRVAMGNQWLFRRRLLKKMISNIGTNAVVRTTIVTTIVNSGNKDNVIPPIAKAIVNARILPGETVDDIENFIREKIKDGRVSVLRYGAAWNPTSTLTSTNSLAFKNIESLINQQMPQVISVPLIVIGATDSRYFRNISDGVINFSPTIDSEGQHGIDEHMSRANMKQMILFYTSLFRQAAN